MTLSNAASVEQLPIGVAPHALPPRTEGSQGAQRCLSECWWNATRGTGMRCHWHHGNFARLFPVLWETAKAADRWTAKNPPEAQYSN